MEKNSCSKLVIEEDYYIHGMKGKYKSSQMTKFLIHKTYGGLTD